MFKVLLITIFSFQVMAQMNMENDQVRRIEKVFNDLRATNLEILDDFYAKDVSFLDPLGEHKGLDSVKKYYGNLYKNVESIRFEFSDSITEGSKHLVVWKMFLKAKSLNSGKEMTLDGNSVIEFGPENKVVYHRDYFDMGEFIYEQIPVLGYIVRKVKEALKN